MILIQNIKRYTFEVSNPTQEMQRELEQCSRFEIAQTFLKGDCIANKVVGASGQVCYTIEDEYQPMFPCYISRISIRQYQNIIASIHDTSSGPTRLMTRYNLGNYNGVEKWALRFKQPDGIYNPTYLVVITDVQWDRDLGPTEERYFKERFEHVANESLRRAFFVSEKIGSIDPIIPNLKENGVVGSVQ